MRRLRSERRLFGDEAAVDTDGMLGMLDTLSRTLSSGLMPGRAS
jgi:hypothetical protein